MALKLDLTKSTDALVLNLQKRGVPTPPPVQVAIDMDVSYSFNDEHRDGLTQDLLTRLVPWICVFDTNKEGDFFTFSNGEANAHHVGPINTGNYQTYIQDQVIRKVPGWNGGTDYSHVLVKNLQTFGWLPQPGAAPKKKLFGGFFGGGKADAAAPAPAKQKSLVLFVTDGSCGDDETRTFQVLKDAEARGDEVYFLFLAYSNGGSAGDFKFLKMLGDKFSNTGLVVIPNIPAFTALTDDELNDQLISDELINWLKK